MVWQHSVSIEALADNHHRLGIAKTAARWILTASTIHLHCVVKVTRWSAVARDVGQQLSGESARVGDVVEGEAEGIGPRNPVILTLSFVGSRY